MNLPALYGGGFASDRQPRDPRKQGLRTGIRESCGPWSRIRTLSHGSGATNLMALPVGEPMHRFDALPLVALIVATLTAAAFGAYVIRQHPAVA